MTVARSQQISLDHTPYYHCTARCVRRAFLCGRDRYSGKSFEHRRQWLEDRLVLLSKIFAVDLLAYAIMSNHYHVVVRVNPLESVAWSDEEVVERWGQIYSVDDGDIAESIIAIWRTRLADLSWFMRCINENLARRANREDCCTGRFWEGRFKSQALLDETALLKCMAYVDLNPIREKMASTPESSEHTSIKSRIEGNDGHLLPFGSTCHDGQPKIPISYEDYLSLVDWSGQALRPGKRGAVSANHPPILERLRLEPDHWIKEMQHFGCWYFRAVGSLQALNRYCEHLGQRWLKGAGQFQEMNV
jgi:REP-associated tyrosine transposase